MTQAIFLSYASQDADAARRICESLRAAGLEVWFDQSELRGGDAWDASIRKQIKECALFIPIITPNTQAREEGYFRLEWKLAVDRSHLMADNKAFFVPVILGDVAEPSALVPDKFRERQWSRLNDAVAIADFAARISKLIAERGVSGINAQKIAPVLVKNSPLEASLLPKGIPLGAHHTSASPYERDASMPFAPKGIPFGNKLSTNGANTGDTPSIAVLAFANRSASADDEYFSDGLADELLNVLAKIKGLRVAARTSAFQFKGKSADISEIGRRLNVAHILEGSVRKSGNRVRVAVQLVKVADGYHLWSETYDRTLEDIFAVQDDIAQSVVQELHSALFAMPSSTKVETVIHNASKGRTENAEAYRLWLQGKHFFKRGSAADRDTAVKFFTQATDVDPFYAAAWASLAHALYWHTASGGAEFHVSDYAAGYERAMAFADRAIALEPNLAEAHVAMAYLHGSMSWDMKQGEAAMRRALALAPGDAEVLYHAGLHLAVRGRMGEALELADRAIERDPLNHQAFSLKGRVLYYLDRLHDAEQCFRTAMALNPDRWGRGFLTLVYLSEKRLDEAAVLNADEPTPEYRLLGECFVDWSRGEWQQADEKFATVIAEYSTFFAWQIAQGFAFRGDADKVFEWMEVCYTQRDPGIHWALMDPLFRPYYADPRWPLMLRKLGFDA